MKKIHFLKIRWIKDENGFYEPICPACCEMPSVAAKSPPICEFCGSPLEFDDLWNERMKTVRARYNGFRANQVWNGSIYVFDPSDRWIMHCQCTKRMNEAQLTEWLKEAIELRFKLFQEE